MSTLNRRVRKEAALNAAVLSTLQYCGETGQVKVKVFISTWYKSSAKPVLATSTVKKITVNVYMYINVCVYA